MATDWAADVKKFVPNADDEVIKGIVRYCGIALQKPDSSLVSYTDPVELGRVRNNFLKKKLGLTDSDATLDGAIAAVGERMKGVNFKNRVTVYYLLLDHLGLLHMFKKGAAVVAGAAAIAGATAMPLAAAAIPAATPAPKTATVAAAPQPRTGPYVPPPNHFAMDHGGKGGLGWILWLLAGLALLWALWVLFAQDRGAVTPATTDNSITVPLTDDANGAAAVPEPVTAAPVVIPAGAGVTSEVRDGKPLVKVYFDTGKSQVVDAFTPAAATLKTYLDANPGTGLGVSGYNDPTGNAAANAALSKNRAQAVQAALVGAGIAATSIELIKPEAATDAQVTKEEARRVEVYIK